MREAFHDQLDSIFDDLAGICGERRDRRPPGHRGAADRRRRDRRAGDQRRRRDRPARERGRGHRVLPALAAAAGRRRPAHVVAALRMVSELERMGDLSVHVAKIARLRVPATSPCPTRSGRPSQRMAEVAEDMVGPGRRSSPSATSRPPLALGRDDEEMDQLRAPASPSCSPTTGARRRGGRRHRPARPLLRADRRPRRLGRQPGRVRRHRRVPGDRADAFRRVTPYASTRQRSRR
jgi:phosphate transport system protein